MIWSAHVFFSVAAVPAVNLSFNQPDVHLVVLAIAEDIAGHIGAGLG